MVEMNALDARLAALSPVIEELKALRARLKQLSDKDAFAETPIGQNAVFAPADMYGKPPYWHAIKWIDDALNRVEPQLHAGHWPPVWWRLSGLNIDSVFRNFYRADADGYFYEPDPDSPGFGKGYIPERDEIMAWVQRIDDMSKHTRKQRRQAQ